jgi:AcrR family transcriptional regulator
MPVAFLTDRPSAKTYRIGNVRNRLVDAALAILEQSGPHQLNLRKIAARAGVAPSTVYYHYKNKEDLLGWLAQSGFESLREAMAQGARDGHSRSQLQGALGAYVDFARRRPQLYQLMYLIHDRGELDAVLTGEHAAFAEMAQAVDHAARGRYPQETVEDCSVAIWAAGRGIAAIALSATNATESDRSSTIQHAMRGLEFLISGRRAAE